MIYGILSQFRIFQLASKEAAIVRYGPSKPIVERAW